MLALVTALGLLVRLYRLPEQSVWHDEFLALCHFNAPDAGRNIALISLYIPENMKAPLHYVLQYWFANHVTDSLLALRLVSVFLGVLCIPVLFLLARRMFGVRPALVAALLLALSPQHVWYAQEVRTYALSNLMALLSFYCVFRGAQGGGRGWWAASLLINAVLPWTHLMFFPVVMAEGCFLLWWWRGRPFRVAAWAAAQFLLILPMVVNLLIGPFSQAGGSPVGASEILTAFFAVDSVNLYPDLCPPWKSAPGNPPAWLEALLSLRTPADGMLGAFYVLCLLFTLAAAARRPSVRRGAGVRPGLVYALALWLAPVALLAVLNLATEKPFLSFMYCMYGMAGAYAAAGWMVCAAPSRALRRALLAGLILVYAYNLSLLLPFTTRTDWRGLAEHVALRKGPADVIVNLETYGPTNPLEYYQGEIGLPVMRAGTIPGICRAVTEAFVAPGGRGVPDRVWVTYREQLRRAFFPEEDTVAVFKARLTPCGLHVREHLFPGQYNVTLLEITRAEGRTPSLFPGATAEDDNGHEALLDSLGLTFSGPEDREAALRVLREGAWMPRGPELPVIWGPSALDLVTAGRPDLAEAVLRWQIGRVPKAATLHFCLGAALFAQGRVEEAAASFEAAHRYQPSLRLLSAPLTGPLLRGDKAAARAELERMRPWGWAYYIPVFDHLLREDAPAG